MCVCVCVCVCVNKIHIMFLYNCNITKRQIGVRFYLSITLEMLFENKAIFQSNTNTETETFNVDFTSQ